MDENNETVELKSPEKSGNILFVIGGLILLLTIAGAYYFFTKVYAKNGTTESNVSVNENSKPVDAASEVVPGALGDETAETETVVSGSLGVAEITVSGISFKFTPSSFSVKAGQKVKLTFTNSEGFHDLVFEDLDIRTKQLMAGKSEVVEFTAPTVTGEYNFYCSVGNHRVQGMVGKMIVE